VRVAFLGLTRTPGPQRDYDAISKAHADAGRMLAIVDKVLSAQAYVAGAEFTVADIGICLSAHRWFSLAGDFRHALEPAPLLRFVAEWHRNLSSRQAFKDAISGQLK